MRLANETQTNVSVPNSVNDIDKFIHGCIAEEEEHAHNHHLHCLPPLRQLLRLSLLHGIPLDICCRL